MRVLGSAVLVMESFAVGFALLIAMKDHSGAPMIYGAVIAIALLLAPGFLKGRIGWVLGSLLQVAMLAFGLVVFIPDNWGYFHRVMDRGDFGRP